MRHPSCLLRPAPPWPFARQTPTVDVVVDSKALNKLVVVVPTSMDVDNDDDDDDDDVGVDGGGPEAFDQGVEDEEEDDDDVDGEENGDRQC
jgi:hypothetical protein